MRPPGPKPGALARLSYAPNSSECTAPRDQRPWPEGLDGQRHFRDHFRADERLVSPVLPSLGPQQAAPGTRAFPLEWRISGGDAESLLFPPPGGFVDGERPALLRGCGYRSRAVRRATHERCRGRRGRARARPSRWVARDALAADEKTRLLVNGTWLDNPLLDAWCQARAKDNISLALPGKATVPRDDLGPAHAFKPGFMWEAGIAPPWCRWRSVGWSRLRGRGERVGLGEREPGADDRLLVGSGPVLDVGRRQDRAVG